MLYFGSYYSKENTYWKHLHCCRISNLFCTRLKNRGNVRFIKHLSSVLILKIMFKHNIHMKFLSPLLSELLDMLRKWTDQRKTWKKKSCLTKIVIFPIMLSLIEKNNNVNKKQCNTVLLSLKYYSTWFK